MFDINGVKRFNDISELSSYLDYLREGNIGKPIPLEEFMLSKSFFADSRSLGLSRGETLYVVLSMLITGFDHAGIPLEERLELVKKTHDSVQESRARSARSVN